VRSGFPFRRSVSWRADFWINTLSACGDAVRAVAISRRVAVTIVGITARGYVKHHRCELDLLRFASRSPRRTRFETNDTISHLIFDCAELTQQTFNAELRKETFAPFVDFLHDRIVDHRFSLFQTVHTAIALVTDATNVNGVKNDRFRRSGDRDIVSKCVPHRQGNFKQAYRVQNADVACATFTLFPSECYSCHCPGTISFDRQLFALRPP
jgi:hypothetical protein